MDRNLADFSVSYMDDPGGGKRSGRQGLRYSGSSRPGYIGYILEISFVVLCRHATFQEVTQKVHSIWGWLGIQTKFYDQIQIL